MSRFQYLPGGQWSFIEEMFSRRTRPKGRLFADARLMVEGIVYRYRAAIAGRDVPAVSSPRRTIGKCDQNGATARAYRFL